MCKHPLKGFQIGINEKSGKPRYKITSYNAAYVWRFIGSDVWKTQEMYYQNEKGERCFVIDSPSLNPNIQIVRNFIEIPCGQCVECRLQYSKMWAQRIMLESLDHDNTWFITLTYNDDHLPENFSGNPEFQNLYSLYPRDMTLFLKNLRSCSGQKFRYYYCGEYGSKSGRPHYHLILFGFVFDDLQIYKRTEYGDLYISPRFEEIWGKGFCTVARCTYETAAYTARYVMKKAKGNDRDLMIKYGLFPEFVRMSRRPGIARHYFDKNYASIYETDQIFISTFKGSKSFTPPRYFDKLYEALDPDSFSAIKEDRKLAAETIRRLKLAQTDLDYQDMLKAEEISMEKSLSKLVRNL